MRASLCLALWLLAAPALADDPRVQQRAFEAIPNGVFIRGGTTVINLDPRCADGCPKGQQCRQVCANAPCAPDAPPDAQCTACRWRCEE
ncbi:MAG: hypothetical protein SF182_02050 [Deltaproteobacteria bacterium]|nr:hypothetical protein [Deltaproteobacteria bacterium]